MGINVTGSQKLLAAARKTGVRSVVFISLLSAFAGCRSLYGKAKVEIEGVAQSIGAFVIRPGLVYSDNPGGMFGRLVVQVRGTRFVPTLWGGRQVQYLVHDEDLASLVQGCLDGRVPASVEPITVAHEQGWELREILAQIARALGKRVTFVSVPWQLVWLGLKGLELAGRAAQLPQRQPDQHGLPESAPCLCVGEIPGFPVPAISTDCRHAGPADDSLSR
jgi:nucleoside-diphosphate-sugar epimerase